MAVNVLERIKEKIFTIEEYYALRKKSTHYDNRFY